MRCPGGVTPKGAKEIEGSASSWARRVAPSGKLPPNAVALRRMERTIPTLTLYFGALLENFNTGAKVTDQNLLRLCDGIRESHGLTDFFAPHLVPPGLELHHVAAMLRFSDGGGLSMQVQFVTSRAMTDAEVELIAHQLHRILESDWSYEFSLPPALQHCQVHFETTPRSMVPSGGAAQIERLAAEWPSVTFEQIASLSDAELDSLLRRLAIVAPLVRYDWSTPAKAAVRSLLEVAETNKQRRAVDRVAAAMPPDDERF